VRAGRGRLEYEAAARATAERFGMDAMAAKLTELYGMLKS
jgi:hypothetical protein